MKKDMDIILKELIADYQAQRSIFGDLAVEQRDVAVQAMANTLVLIQTQLNNILLHQQRLNLEEELVQKKLVTKDIRDNGIDRLNTDAGVNVGD